MPDLDRTDILRSATRWSRAVAVSLFALSGAACASRTAIPGLPAPIDTLSIREDTRVLAHDSLGGRGTGSAGARSAGRYIATRLRQLDLRPLATGASSIDAFLDSVPLQRADVGAATLTVSGGAALAHGAQFVVGRVGRAGLHSLAAPVAVLGADSTAVSPGSWLLVDRPLGEAAARWIPIWRERGVAGVVVRLGAESTVQAYHEQLGDTRWQLRDGPPDPVWQPDLPIVMVGPALAASLAGPNVVLAFDPRARIDTATDYNVVGVLSRDGDATRDFVALTAHYDHLGTVPGLAPDSIFNGFSDNAAGVAMLLAIARSASAAPPGRPLLFLFTTGEEVGLLGSIHFVRTHPDLVARIHAVVNLDAGAPPAPPTRWRLAAGTRSWAGAVAASVVESHGWAHRSDPGSPNSDHWPFVALGIPAVFLIPDGGFENLDDAASRSLSERWDRYHQPGDEWFADFPFSGLQRYAELGRDIAYALAAAPAGAE